MNDPGIGKELVPPTCPISKKRSQNSERDRSYLMIIDRVSLWSQGVFNVMAEKKQKHDEHRYSNKYFNWKYSH